MNVDFHRNAGHVEQIDVVSVPGSRRISILGLVYQHSHLNSTLECIDSRSGDVRGGYAEDVHIELNLFGIDS